MTSETDHPRQRTVAELLAEHGGGAATGRRSRRRAADGPDDVESSGGPALGGPAHGGPALGGPSYDHAPPAVPDRRILREPVPQDEPPRRATPEVRRPPAHEGRRESPTDRMPRVPERAPQRFAEPPLPPAQAPPPMRDGGPPTMIGAPPAGAQQWHRSRTEQRRPDIGGPPTQAGAPLELDDDDFDDYDDAQPAGRALDDDLDDEPRRGARGVAGLRADRSVDVADDLEDYADEYADDYDDEYEDQDVDDLDDADEVRDDEDERRPSRRREAADEPAGTQSWGAIVAQWVLGAIGGAALWVAFRFLWQDLQVVAIFAAILVTGGLVLVVRYVLRTTDLRTTGFAVAVGLLLTVSPVILSLLGK